MPRSTTTSISRPATRKGTPPDSVLPGRGPYTRRTRRAAVGRLYQPMGPHVFDAAEGDSVDRGRAGFLEPILRELGLATDLSDALEDSTLDMVVRAETNEALALTGNDVGTPILHFRPPTGVAFFGPVISRLPKPEQAERLWDTSSAWRVSRGSRN